MTDIERKLQMQTRMMATCPMCKAGVVPMMKPAGRGTTEILFLCPACGAEVELPKQRSERLQRERQDADR